VGRSRRCEPRGGCYPRPLATSTLVTRGPAWTRLRRTTWGPARTGLGRVSQHGAGQGQRQECCDQERSKAFHGFLLSVASGPWRGHAPLPSVGAPIPVGSSSPPFCLPQRSSAIAPPPSASPYRRSGTVRQQGRPQERRRGGEHIVRDAG